MKSAEIDPAQSIEDRVGLDKAYASEHNVYAEGDTLYVSGTSSVGDVVDDIGIPFGLTNRTKMYAEANAVMNKNPQIKTIVGHSLGGSVALTIAQQYQLESRTYGAPVMSIRGGERYRNVGDPVSALDYGAHTSYTLGINPHSYQNVATKTHLAKHVGANSFDKNGIVNMYR